MGNDTSIMAFVKDKLNKSEQRAVSSTSNETSASMISHNKKDVESHHGLVLQRFDSADWAMMQKSKKDPHSKGQTKSRMCTTKEQSNGEKVEKTDMAFSPKLKPSEISTSNQIRSSPLGKPR